MPNWVRNTVTIRGNNEKVRELLSRMETTEWLFDFNAILPIPADVSREPLDMIDMEDETKWYGWCRKHWGTKWNARHVTMMVFGGVAYIRFDTAWNMPIPVMNELRNLFPELDIQNDFADEDIGRNCGTWRNGVITFPDDPEKFAYMVWSR